jgi:hypothetical protein
MDTKDQKKLTEGKGWGVLNFTRESPYKVVTDYAKEKKKQITEKVKNIASGVEVVAKKLEPGTVKKVREKIQKIKDKKKRGPLDE